MRYSRKHYYEAYQYLGPETVHQFQDYGTCKTDNKGRLQFYYNERDHIGIPMSYWLVIDHTAEYSWDKYKVYNNENFKKLFVPEEDEKFLRHTNCGCNPVYPERPYPNNIHKIKEVLGLSNMKLGKMCGLGYGVIANMDRGDRPVTDEYKELIEKATNFEVVRFYD